VSITDLNAPSAGELLGKAPDINDGSKGARNIRTRRGMGTGRNKGSLLTTPIEQEPKTRYEVRRNYLNQDRETWRDHWLDVKKLFVPYRTRWLDDGGLPNRGNKKMQYVVDDCPMIALRTMKAGLMAGMTSPSRPWFRLRPGDDDLYQKPGVAEWCEKATDAVHRILAKSNFYRMMPTFYEEIGAFGTAAIGVYEVPYDIRRKYQPLINCMTYTAGEYWIAQNDEGKVDTFIRKYKWTVRQIVMKFVSDREDPDCPDWDNLSTSTIGQWRNRQWETYVDIVHVLEPNDQYEKGVIGPKGMRCRSVYYEIGGDPSQLLAVKGFPENPVKVARWDVNSDSTYGHSPAMYCLGDSKQLMLQQKRKMQAIDKQIEPPLIGDASLKRSTVSQLPGEITWLEMTAATTHGLKPLYEVKPEISAMVEDIQETRGRIKTAMYEDVFQMMKSLDSQLKAGITATEINARKQEQLLELGPLLDRLTGEVLEPIIEDTFALAVKRSRMAWQMLAHGLQPGTAEMYMPPPPKALAGKDLHIEYISILAQAQRVSEIQGIDQTTQYALQLVEADPSALDKIDFDKAITIIADRTGVPPEMIRDDDAVAAMRQKRAQAQQAQAQTEKMGAAAQAAKNLGQTPLGGTNALDQLLNGQPGGQPAQ
jgi:hypothetical protein